MKQYVDACVAVGTDVLCAVEAFRYRFEGEGGWESVFYEAFPDRGAQGWQAARSECDVDGTL